VKVDGEVRGDILGSEKVIISRTGRVQGNIKAPRMTLEDGAKFKGSIDMDPGEVAKPAPKPEARPVAAQPAVPAKAANGSSPTPLPEKAKPAPGLNLESK
jgi:cytoskeletal protein CcmA (bactofilin family)